MGAASSQGKNRERCWFLGATTVAATREGRCSPVMSWLCVALMLVLVVLGSVVVAMLGLLAARVVAGNTAGPHSTHRRQGRLHPTTANRRRPMGRRRRLEVQQ
jgi:hypothetical protein